MNEQKDECCPKFNPEPWYGQTLTWTDKLFVKDNVACFFHVPLNMGKVITRMAKQVQDAGAAPANEEFMILSHDLGNWKSEQYMSVTKEVEGAENVKLSGTFLTKVFEGPYKEARNWCTDMEQHVKDQGKELEKLYFFYTTCPKCAKKWGKNYVVGVAKIK